MGRQWSTGIRKCSREAAGVLCPTLRRRDYTVWMGSQTPSHAAMEAKCARSSLPPCWLIVAAAPGHHRLSRPGLAACELSPFSFGMVSPRSRHRAPHRESHVIVGARG
jgi:hypothetical protein